MTFAVSELSAAQIADSSRHDVRDYALAHLGKSFFWVAGDALTLFVLIRQGGFSPAWAGVSFLGAMSLNAVGDIVVGHWADRGADRGRAMAPILIAAVPLIGVSFAASLFLSSRYWGWTVVAILVFRLAYAVFDVPHNTMMSRLSQTPAIGLRIAKLRTIGSGLASLVVGVVTVPLLEHQAESVALPLVGVLIVASVLLMVPYLSNLPRLERLPRGIDPVCTDAQIGSPTLGLAGLCTAAALLTAALAALSKALMQVDIDHNTWASSALLTLSIGRVGAIGIAGTAIARFGRDGAFRAALLCATLLILVLPAAINFDPMAATGVILLIGVANGLEIITSWILLNASVRSSAQSSRQGSMRVATFTMTTKLASGTGGLLLGLTLSGLTPDGILDSITLWSLCLCAAAGTALGVLAASPRLCSLTTQLFQPR